MDGGSSYFIFAFLLKYFLESILKTVFLSHKYKNKVCIVQSNNSILKYE